MEYISKVDNQIKGIWYRMDNKSIEVNKNNIRELTSENGLIISDIVKTEIGLDSIAKGYYFYFNDIKYLFPEKKICELVDNKEKNILKSNSSYWEKVDWFFPPFIRRAEVYEAFESVGLRVSQVPDLSQGDLKCRVNNALKNIYNLRFICESVESIFKKSFAIKEHVPLIKESILAFYGGYSSLSISALIPIIEDILFKISDEENENLKIHEKQNKALKKAKNYVKNLSFKGADWYPKEYDNENFLLRYDERYRLISSIDLWLSNSFYANTKAYADGERYSGFNRHAFAHASNKLWQDKTNFFRAIGLMQALAFVEVFSGKKSKVSIFPPQGNEQSRNLYNKTKRVSAMHCLLRRLSG